MLAFILLSPHYQAQTFLGPLNFRKSYFLVPLMPDTDHFSTASSMLLAPHLSGTQVFKRAHPCQCGPCQLIFLVVLHFLVKKPQAVYHGLHDHHPVITTLHEDGVDNFLQLSSPLTFIELTHIKTIVFSLSVNRDPPWSKAPIILLSSSISSGQSTAV